jgi:hypothetical protein
MKLFRLSERKGGVRLAVVALFCVATMMVLTSVPFLGEPITNATYDWGMEHLGDLGSSVIMGSVMYLRKVVHALLFGFIAFFSRSVLQSGGLVQWSKESRWSPWVLVMAFVVVLALVDENIQRLLPERHGSLLDVLFDVLGGMAGLGVWWGWNRVRDWWRDRRAVGEGALNESHCGVEKTAVKVPAIRKKTD